MNNPELKECGIRRAASIAKFDQVEQRNDGTTVVNSLADGLTCLRKLLFERVHDDVERQFGMDSMLMPVSEDRTKAKALLEIELYEIAISAIHVQNHGYVNESEPWFVDWLSAMRVGEKAVESSLVQQRLSDYMKLEKAERRLAFTDALVRAIREAGRAPLVLYRLFPLAIKVVTSVAFGDVIAATKERDRQIAFLPSIADCSACHGRPLDNGDICRTCGNPIWRFEWLTATD
jgi:hypothetical protein